jgi:hypothetical protein
MRLRYHLWVFALLGGIGLIALPASYVAAHHWINAPSTGELPFHDSFARGDLSSWDGIGMRQLCCEHSIQIRNAPLRPGQRAAEFMLKRSDPDVKGSRRAELRLHAAQWNQAYDYSMRVFVPTDWVIDSVPVTVAQWHNVPDLWRLEWGLPSVLRLDIRGDEWVLELCWGSGQLWLDRNLDLHSIILWHGALERGRWISWSFDVRWSDRDDGVVDAWKDGRLVAHHVGPSAYVDTLAPYFKFGLYVPAWKVFPNARTATDVRTIWFSDVAVLLSRKDG